eukprot:UN04183
MIKKHYIFELGYIFLNCVFSFLFPFKRKRKLTTTIKNMTFIQHQANHHHHLLVPSLRGNYDDVLLLMVDQDQLLAFVKSVYLQVL